MSEWILGPDVLAHTRLEVSHLAVAVASLRLAVASRSPELDEIVAGDTVAAALVTEGVRPRWTADCFAVPAPPGASLEEELDAVRAQSDAKVREDIAITIINTRADSAPSPVRATVLPDVLVDGQDLGEVAARVLSRTWRSRIAPGWEQLRWVLEADIVSRTTALRRDGWAAALEGMRPGTTYRRGGAVSISALDLPAQNLGDADLSLHPIPGATGFTMCDASARRFALTYPATGTGLAPTPVGPPALARLIGPNRAAILRLLETPQSPSQIAARTALPLGSIGRHLAILLDAGLVSRRRSGREVLYWQTRRGAELALV